MSPSGDLLLERLGLHPSTGDNAPGSGPCIHAYMHTCMHTYIHTYIDTYIHTHNTYIHTYMHAYIHAYIHTYIYTYIHVYVPVCKNVYNSYFFSLFQTRRCSLFHWMIICHLRPLQVSTKKKSYPFSTNVSNMQEDFALTEISFEHHNKSFVDIFPLCYRWSHVDALSPIMSIHLERPIQFVNCFY